MTNVHVDYDTGARTATIHNGDNSYTLTNVHNSFLCKGRNCSIHNPSNHHMRDLPMEFRPDKGIMERTCKHGVGHTDPDDVNYLKSVGREAWGIHGCDGCCATRPMREGFLDDAAMAKDADIVLTVNTVAEPDIQILPVWQG